MRSMLVGRGGPVGAPAKGMPMNWNQMDYFMRVYRMGNFAAAAREVPMSSQGMTKAVRALEAELGVPLFAAGEGTTLRPTGYAEEFAAFCEECMAAHARLDEGFARVRGQTRRTVHLAAAIGAFGLLGMEFVPTFCREHPGIEVVCDDLPDVKVDAALLDGSDTLGLTVQPAAEGLETVPLCSCERCIWVRSDSPLAKRRRLTVRDLDGQAVALVGPLFKNYGQLLGLLDEQGVRPAEIVTSSEMMWLHQFVHDGRGIAFTARSVLSLYADDASVVAIPIEGMPYEIGISWRRDHALDEAEQAFVDACVKKARPTLTGRLREIFGSHA